MSFSAVGLALAAEQRRLRRAVDVGVDQPDLLAQRGPARRRGWRPGSTCRRRPCRCRWRSAVRPGLDGGERDAALPRRRAAPSAAARRSRSSARGSVVEPGRVGDQRGDRRRPACANGFGRRRAARRGGSAGRRVGHGRRHRNSFDACHCFSAETLPIMGAMSIFIGAGRAGRGLFSDTKGPWGPTGAAAATNRRRTTAASGPWGEPPKRGRGERRRSGNVTSLDDFLRAQPGPLRRRRRRRVPGPARPVARPVGAARLRRAVAAVHDHSQDRAGAARRRHPLRPLQPHAGPGVSLTLPSPIDRVREDRRREYPQVEPWLRQPEETLMLTGDQNILDIDYSVRWNIRDPEQYLFELAEPEETIRQVAESAMRAVIARSRLQDAMGDRRGDIEAQVRRRCSRRPRHLSVRRPDPGHRHQAGRSAGRGQRRLQGGHRRPAGRADDTQPGQCLCPAATARRRRARRPRSTRSTSNTGSRPK